ncbi:MAG: FAD:protein FMN transferase [Acutalibacteraceae bacterium]
MKKALSIMLCALMLLSFTSCENQKELTKDFTAMNTLISIRVFGISDKENEKTVRLFTDKINELSVLFDANNENSDVKKVNASDKSCEVSSYTADIIKKSITASEKTKGCFDITVMPVLKLWGFDNGLYGVPEAENISKALSNVSYKSISVKGNTVTKKPDTEISLGGIAKGYIGDELLKIAEEYKVNAIISLGGNIVLCGDNQGKGYYTVGVKNPLDQNELLCTFESVGNKSVVTSGAYERYFEKDGKTYHHIIDTSTGYPSESDLLSVTVIGENGAFCDAYSTALFSMGKEKAVAFANENHDFSYILVTDKNEVITVGDIQNLEILDDDFK